MFENKETEFDNAKMIVATLLVLYFTWCNFQEFRNYRTLLDIVIFPIHEVGHYLFIPFGRFMTIAGGTIMQILVPVFCTITFFGRGERFSAAVTTMWLGNSLFGVSIYARDAIYMELPLSNFSGPSENKEGHDWHNMLMATNMLPHTDLVANFFVVLGVIASLAGIIGVFYYARETNPADGYEY